MGIYCRWWRLADVMARIELLTRFHVVWLEIHSLWWNVGATEPLVGCHRQLPQNFGGWKQIILEIIIMQKKHTQKELFCLTKKNKFEGVEIYFDTGNDERQRLNRIGCQRAETVKFDIFY
jgi:hypothetical protein